MSEPGSNMGKMKDYSLHAAWLLILGAVSQFSIIIALLILGRGVYFDLTLVLSTLLAIGIARHDEGARRITILLLGIGFVISIALIISSTWMGRVQSFSFPLQILKKSYTLKWWIGIPLSAFGASLCALPLWWLTRPGTRQGFQQSAGPSIIKMGKQSVSIIIVAFLVLTGAQILLGSSLEKWKDPFDVYSARDHIGIGYGYRYHKLAYAVFITPSENVAFSYVSEADPPKLAIRRDDDKKITKLSNKVLHEWTNGKLYERDANITEEEFEAYLNSNPSTYSIDSLLEFLEQKHAKPLTHDPNGQSPTAPGR